MINIKSNQKAIKTIKNSSNLQPNTEMAFNDSDYDDMACDMGGYSSGEGYYERSYDEAPSKVARVVGSKKPRGYTVLGGRMTRPVVVSGETEKEENKEKKVEPKWEGWTTVEKKTKPAKKKPEEETKPAEKKVKKSEEKPVEVKPNPWSNPKRMTEVRAKPVEPVVPKRALTWWEKVDFQPESRIGYMKEEAKRRNAERTASFEVFQDPEKLQAHLTKTSMCRYRDTCGRAERGEVCRFAHDISELQPKMCTYGRNCRFMWKGGNVRGGNWRAQCMCQHYVEGGRLESDADFYQRTGNKTNIQQERERLVLVRRATEKVEVKKEVKIVEVKKEVKMVEVKKEAVEVGKEKEAPVDVEKDIPLKPEKVVEVKEIAVETLRSLEEHIVKLPKDLVEDLTPIVLKAAWGNGITNVRIVTY